MAIDNIFFLDGKMYRRIKIVKSDDSVVAFDFEEEERVWLPRRLVERESVKGYSISETARLIGVASALVKDAVKSNIIPRPHMTYNPVNYKPGRYYFDGNDLMEIRDSLWEHQPKNKYGEPYKDKIISKSDLEVALYRGDERNFVKKDGELIQIFSV